MTQRGSRAPTGETLLAGQSTSPKIEGRATSLWKRLVKQTPEERQDGEGIAALAASTFHF
jgi:hypothetical protein